MTTPDLTTMVVAYAETLDAALEPWGPRVGFDSGDPQTSGITFFDAGGVSVGVWECTPGGWTITNRPDTETMMVLDGRVRITPLDGEAVELVEGDVFVLPRGWSGRWDVLDTVRKFWVTVTHG